MTVSVERALQIVLEHTPVLGQERVPLAEALGRVLAEDVRADMDMPPFERAAMDGYALRSADALQAPVTLDVRGEVRAGQAPLVAGPGPGQAVRIMTGAPLPPGADAVLPVEQTRGLDEGRRVELLAAVTPGQHVAPRGSEWRTGDLLLEHGLHIDAATIAVLAAVGGAQACVGLRPRVALLATGDELVDVADVPGPGQIRNSNGPALAALARLAGADAYSLGCAPDQAERLYERLAEGLRSDVLLVSGGVSAGDYDLVEPALARLGFRALFDRVSVKPGAPLVFGLCGATLVFGLPGNPVSTQVTFELFVRPALLRMQGRAAGARVQVEAELLQPVSNRSKRTNHLPARLHFEQGRFVAEPLPSQGSADVRAHARANALLVMAPERLRAERGERVPALLLGSFLE